MRPRHSNAVRENVNRVKFESVRVTNDVHLVDLPGVAVLERYAGYFTRTILIVSAAEPTCNRAR